MTRDRIEELYLAGKINTDECPGPPCAGACEFCPGPCVTLSVDGVTLTEEDGDLLWEVQMKNGAERPPEGWIG